MSRRASWAAGVTALAVVAFGVGFVYLRGGSTPLAVDNTVERFRMKTQASRPETASPSYRMRRAPDARHEPGTSAAVAVAKQAPTFGNASEGGRPLPDEGVYAYATKGGDDVDALGGSRHDYPAETTITVRHAGCGLIERWDALEERWDERETCRTDGGEALKSTTSYHEFFRHGDKRTFTCDSGTLAWNGSTTPGSSWSGRCVSEATTVHLVGTVVGPERLRVGEAFVDTLHVRVEARLSGEQKGTGRHDVWGASASGLAVREIATTDTDSVQPVLGRVHYHERYEVNLLSLQPRR